MRERTHEIKVRLTEREFDILMERVEMKRRNSEYGYSREDYIRDVLFEKDNSVEFPPELLKFTNNVFDIACYIYRLQMKSCFSYEEKQELERLSNYVRKTARNIEYACKKIILRADDGGDANG